MKNYSFGIIGAGNHFKKNILPALNKIKSIKIDGYLLINQSKSKKPKYLKENVFFKKKFDFVFISTPNIQHEKYIIKSLENNFHTLCEKPILTSSKNLSKIKNLSIKNKKILFECFMYKYHNSFKYLEKIISKKIYGNPIYSIGRFTFPALNKNNNRYNKYLGNGFIYDIVSYFVSLEFSLFENSKNLKIVNQKKIKENTNLRGSLLLKNNNFQKFYFWGESQIYRNEIEIFFKKATVYFNFFFSKPKNKLPEIMVYKKNKTQNINLKIEDHFFNMFLHILKKYKNRKFQIDQLSLIEKQTKFLEKISKN